MTFESIRNVVDQYLHLCSNGCSLPGDQNPMNWKHGGSITDHNGIKYEISPTRERPPPPERPQGRCKTASSVLHYKWSVEGGGFFQGDAKASIEKQMRGCGAVTAFKFEYFSAPRDDGTEWRASGTLPWTISDHCVAKAVKSAGGFSSRC